jgi:1,4-dihydroxy-2-naphthoate octaprenyltransferase
MSSTAHLSPAATGLVVRPGSAAAWSIAMRPKTLWIAAIPVMVGSSIAFVERGAFDLGNAVLALAASIVIQIISNLQNDVGYTARGAESGRRVGLPRATANGWLSPLQVRAAIVGCTLLAVALGLPLVLQWGWVVMAMGIASLVGAVSYMGGPRPIAYTPLGETTVFAFFGLVAVTGSAYVQIGEISPACWLAALAIGMQAAAVLAVNNHRDIDHDRASGRGTFAVRFGARASRAMYGVLTIAPYPLVVAAAFAAGAAWLALPLATLPRAIALLRDFGRTPPGPGFNNLLFRTVMLEVAFGGLLTVGGIVSGLR